MTTLAIAHLRHVRLGPDIARYLATIDATLAPFGGRFLVHGERPTMLEGEFESDVVIIAFPDRDSAERWYRSPAYQAILRLRTDNSDAETFLIDAAPPGYRAASAIPKLFGVANP